MTVMQGIGVGLFVFSFISIFFFDIAHRDGMKAAFVFIGWTLAGSVWMLFLLGLVLNIWKFNA